jgi:FkbM family methyltransferase
MFERHLDWTGYNIEAWPQHFLRLQTNRPKSTNLNCALSNNSSEAVFVQAVHPVLGNRFGNGSLKHSDIHKSELEKMGCTFERVSIQTKTWNSICEEYSIRHVDLMVLDVEGHESEVISGMTKASVLPMIAVVEAWPDKLDLVKSQMEALGYIYDGNYLSNLFFRHPKFEFEPARN